MEPDAAIHKDNPVGPLLISEIFKTISLCFEILVRDGWAFPNLAAWRKTKGEVPLKQ